MIYLVSKQPELFKTDLYQKMSPEEAVRFLSKYSILGADTETEGMNPHSKKLLTVQLGTFDDQVVWDCTTEDVQLLKPILENPNIKTIWWNALFDLRFLYKQRIFPNNVYDGYLAEKLMWLGYPAGTHSMSLKSAGKYYCNIELDKSIRGKIISSGLSQDVIIYSANDTKYETKIYESQLKLLEKKGLLKAIQFENEFVKVLAYIEYCGVKLDVNKWKNKMKKDAAIRDKHLKELNTWVVEYFKEHRIGESFNIRREYVVDTQWIHPNTKEWDEYVIGKGLKELSPELESTEPIERKVIKNFSKETGSLYVVVYGVKFPFVKQDLQGDLWSGFNTDPICTINWNSAAQIIPLFELLGFNLTTFDKKTKNKKKSVEAKIIEPQKHICPIASIYLEYTAAQKVTSTYGENFLNAITPETGRIHPSYSQLGGDTGRLSSGGGENSINIQNLPKNAETRSCFVAEKGNKFISCDYQSQESQLIASISNDKAMLDLFTTGCRDAHSLVAYMSYPDIIPRDTRIEDIKKLYPEARQNSKGIEFAMILSNFVALFGNIK